MPEDDFYKPTDIDALRMENEFLAFEVRFLKAQLAEAKRLKSRLEESERSKAELSSRLAESERSKAELSSRLAKSERAEEDLALLLRRLGSSPLGPVFRLKQGFRTLEERYLNPHA